jgi:hypothetical protein
MHQVHDSLKRYGEPPTYPIQYIYPGEYQPTGVLRHEPSTTTSGSRSSCMSKGRSSRMPGRTPAAPACVSHTWICICVYICVCIAREHVYRTWTKLDIKCLGCSHMVAFEVCELFLVGHTCVRKFLANAQLGWACMCSHAYCLSMHKLKEMLIITIGRPLSMSKFGTFHDCRGDQAAKHTVQTTTEAKTLASIRVSLRHLWHGTFLPRSICSGPPRAFAAAAFALARD